MLETAISRRTKNLWITVNGVSTSRAVSPAQVQNHPGSPLSIWASGGKHGADHRKINKELD
ncbi:MAG: hypothetical protein DRQ24_07970 [Candidatus Latescibacterota bacterium]|nr:MAG: hypothetical protein DRQ24_07970 [Candidatus Latescibacterota bacterium]